MKVYVLFFSTIVVTLALFGGGLIVCALAQTGIGMASGLALAGLGTLCIISCGDISIASLRQSLGGTP